MTTKVYAGNTVAAEQRSDFGEYVVWQHQDPLTQSFTTTSKTGVAYEADEPEFNAEFEPLGQRIEAVDPSPGYPDEYTEITDIASQPKEC